MNITYYEIYHNCNNKKYLASKRLEMVRRANDYGIKSTARFYKTSKNTIKRWCRRYALYGIKGLYNLSSRPHNIHYKVSDHDRSKVIKATKIAHKKNKHITVNNIRKKTKVSSYSDVTINRLINIALEKKKRNKKHESEKNRSIEFKKELKPFDLIQIDIKYLTDIENLKPYFNGRNLSKYQITARDVATGLALTSYCEEKSLYYTYRFLKLVLYPFLKTIPNLDLKQVKIQTDNGSEFTNRLVKSLGTSPKTSAFTLFCNNYFKGHRLIIPGHCTADSEVESFHWSIERDCLGWDDIKDNKTLLKYVNLYLKKYNTTVIKKRGYSPLQKIQEYYNIISIPKAIVL